LIPYVVRSLSLDTQSHNIFKIDTLLKYRWSTPSSGMDEHFVKNDTYENDVVIQISKNIDILEKIHYLENNEKVFKIDDPTYQILYDHLNYFQIKRFNMHAGGLYDDWNYNIDEFE
jgi:hypothetical protein